MSTVCTRTIKALPKYGKALSIFTGNKVKVLLPMYHERRLLGLLCLGEKTPFPRISRMNLKSLEIFRRKAISTSPTR